MKAVVKLAAGAGHLELREVPVPRPEPNQVLLKVQAAGICGTDLHILAGEYPCRPPVILGHEMAGIIYEVGANVTDWAVGDNVTSLPYAVVCGECDYCRAGQFGLCTERLSYGSGVNGAIAEYIAVNASGLYRLPANPDFIAGALTEPLACVTKAVFEVAQLQEHERVLILGPGPIGLLTLLVARAVGARVVMVGRESDTKRLELAKTLGAEQVYFSSDSDLTAKLQEHMGANAPDVIFECSGAGAAFRLALQLVCKQGRVIQVGLFAKNVEVDLNAVVFKDLTICGSFTSSLASWERAVELSSSGKLNLRALVSDVFSLKDYEQAFRHSASGSGLKVVFSPSGEAYETTRR